MHGQRMPRALKVFKTHIGFYDLVVAAPSMKAAAQAWETNPRIFAQGFAAVTTEPDAVKAALEQPGLVLRRPHGQSGPYKAEPDKPTTPKVTTRQKAKIAKAEKDRAREEKARKKAQAAAERRAKAAAKDELADIEQEEAKLRQRRRALQKQFHLRSV
jgi:colicin import membrane protein